MRASWSLPLMLLIGGLTASVAVGASNGVQPDDVLKPASVRLATAGQAALAKNDAPAAIDQFEAALAADPKNVAAYNGMARAYEVQGLTGKSVRYYRDALSVNPSDLAALEGQGRVLAARGATARAQVNLQRIKALCKTDCSAATRLQSALNTATASAAVPKAEAKN